MLWPWPVYVFTYTTYHWIYISPHFLPCHNCCYIWICLYFLMTWWLLRFQRFVGLYQDPARLRNHTATSEAELSSIPSSHCNPLGKLMENPSIFWVHPPKKKTGLCQLSRNIRRLSIPGHQVPQQGRWILALRFPAAEPNSSPGREAGRDAWSMWQSPEIGW